MAEKRNVEQVIEHLKKDKKTAAAVRAAINDQLGSGYVEPVQVDITGAPQQVAQFRHYKHQEQAALFEAREQLFFRKIEVDVDLPNDGGKERRMYLMTKGRVSTGVTHDDWLLLSWTAPITELIRDASIGKIIERERPRTGLIEKLTVRARGIYAGTLQPKITDVTYQLGGRAIFVADENKYLEDDVSAEQAVEVAPEAKPPKEYEAATDFGLHEIIQQADPKQWRTLHLPFKKTVLVEGPPGSGKTSIGLMRVPCLIDRQWDEMGLNPERDAPFHQASTMAVLVMNEEMIDYLARLIRTVGVQGLPVTTMEDFCRRLCRDGGTLGGRTVRESDVLTGLKHHPLAFSAVWAGLRRSVESFWRSGAGDFLERLSSRKLVPCVQLVKQLESWKERMIRADEPTVGAPSPNLAEIIRRWQEQAGPRDHDRGVPSGAAESRREELKDIKEDIGRFGRAIFDRARLFESMLQTKEMTSLLAANSIPAHDKVIEEWRKQTRGDVQHISEGDLLLHARLARHLTLLRGFDGTLPFGGGLAMLTHVMIDEAQDIALDHVKLIQSLLHTDGTLTLVGDLRQRVTNLGFFKDWADLELGKCTNAVFKINHRQSQPLGVFISDLHKCLFGSKPDWKPSNRKNAPKPRIRPKRGFSGLAAVVAQEVRHWRELIPGATVGIVYHGRRWNQATKFAARIEDALGDTLTKVRVAASNETGQLSRVDCAIIASVEITKGLEFDAVVFIDRHKDWTGQIEEVDEVRRNGLYVACSRAKHGLSLILDDRCELLSTGLSPTLFDLEPVVHSEREMAEEDDDFDDDPTDSDDDQ